MTQILPIDEPGQIDFLRQHGLTPEDLSSGELTWDLLNSICLHHKNRIGDLESIAAYLSSRLQTVSEVHSLKIRIKDPGHLAAKLIRKKLEKPESIYSADTYDQQITDLIGIRALHLFKDDWRPIHEFVTQEWELEEQPIAYVRKGDPAELQRAFEQAKCEVKEHPFGYRSIHYLVKSRPAKRVCVAELQIRTIFEEGWSEIDHRVRYPRLSNDHNLAQFLRIFNGLAGSADEMGTFVRGLSSMVHCHASQVAEKEQQMAQMEGQLKAAISKLEISKKDKENLEKQVSEFRKQSNQPTSLDLCSSDTVTNLVSKWLESPSYLPSLTKLATCVVPNLGFTLEQTCSKCGKQFRDSYLTVPALGQHVCPTCRESNVLGFP